MTDTRIPIRTMAHATDLAANATRRMFAIPAERRPVRCDRATFYAMSFEVHRYGTLFAR
jgi:hypothetical protein